MSAWLFRSGPSVSPHESAAHLILLYYFYHFLLLSLLIKWLNLKSFARTFKYNIINSHHAHAPPTNQQHVAALTAPRLTLDSGRHWPKPPQLNCGSDELERPLPRPRLYRDILGP